MEYAAGNDFTETTQLGRNNHTKVEPDTKCQVDPGMGSNVSKMSGMAHQSRGLGTTTLKAAAILLLGLQLAACSSIANPMLGVTKGETPGQAVAMSPGTGFLNSFSLSALVGSTTNAAPTQHQAQTSAPRNETAEIDDDFDDDFDDDSDNDPLEPINRVVFGFNTAVDEIIVEPTARVYRKLPYEVRDSVGNFFANLRSPITLANDVLQGEWDRAGITASRIVINTTLGVGGLHDAALEMGLEPREEDFGQTMALAGVPTGPYLMVPFLGPYSVRHLAGAVVDSFAHPLTWALAGQPLLVQLAPRGAELLSQREKYLDPIDDLKATSPDYYASVRSLYRQSRINSINNGRIDPDLQTESLDEIDFEF